MVFSAMSTAQFCTLSTEPSVSTKIKRHYSNFKLIYLLIARTLVFSFPIATSTLALP